MGTEWDKFLESEVELAEDGIVEGDSSGPGVVDEEMVEGEERAGSESCGTRRERCKADSLTKVSSGGRR